MTVLLLTLAIIAYFCDLIQAAGIEYNSNGAPAVVGEKREIKYWTTQLEYINSINLMLIDKGAYRIVETILESVEAPAGSYVVDWSPASDYQDHDPPPTDGFILLMDSIHALGASVTTTEPFNITSASQDTPAEPSLPLWNNGITIVAGPTSSNVVEVSTTIDSSSVGLGSVASSAVASSTPSSSDLTAVETDSIPSTPDIKAAPSNIDGRPQDDENLGGLSRSVPVLVGIILGSIAAIALIAILTWQYRRRRGRAEQVRLHNELAATSPEAKHELAGESAAATRHELQGDPKMTRPEMPADDVDGAKGVNAWEGTPIAELE